MTNHPDCGWRGRWTSVSPTREAIRAARERVGLTQTQAGALIGVELRKWQKWESGEHAMQAGLWQLWKHVAGIERIPFGRMPTGARSVTPMLA